MWPVVYIYVASGGCDVRSSLRFLQCLRRRGEELHLALTEKSQLGLREYRGGRRYESQAGVYSKLHQVLRAQRSRNDVWSASCSRLGKVESGPKEETGKEDYTKKLEIAMLRCLEFDNCKFSLTSKGFIVVRASLVDGA